MSSMGDYRIECLTYTSNAQAKLNLVGDVGTILNSRCTRESLYSFASPMYALGGAAAGATAELALNHIGEFICVGGKPVWTPSGAESCLPRTEMRGVTIHTPFLVEWDGTVNATFAFESSLGLDMLTLYGALFNKIKKMDRDLSSALAFTIIVAEATTEEIVDKVMIVSPTEQNAPPNGKQIIHETNIERYFSRDVTRQRRRYSPQNERSELLIIVGVGVDMLHTDTENLCDLLSKAFYITPGVKHNANAFVHNHAIVLSRNTAEFDLLRKQIYQGICSLPKITTQILEAFSSNDILSMIHVENDTILRRGFVGVGNISQVTLYP